jgi:hypothetical protein
MACLSPSNDVLDAGNRVSCLLQQPEVGEKLTAITKANGVLDRFYYGHTFCGKL